MQFLQAVDWLWPGTREEAFRLPCIVEASILLRGEMEELNFDQEYSEFENYRRGVVAHREFGDGYDVFSMLRMYSIVVEDGACSLRKVTSTS